MKTASILSVILAFVFVQSLAQYNTGDAQLNASLTIIDNDATVNFAVFKTDVSATYGVSEVKVNTWSVQLGMKGGDIYLILELSKILSKPVDDVVNVYSSNKKKGWGAIAKELGIKPGSPEFHALKGGAGKQADKGKARSKGAKPKGKKS